MEARIGNTGEMVARPLTSTGASGLTSAFVGLLPEYVGHMSSAAETMIRDQVLDLISVSLAEDLETGNPRLSHPRMLASLKVRAAIEARLTDPDLDAETVAAVAGISVRYANALLAQSGTSVTRLIRARRLARCRGALEDPMQQHRTLGEIAHDWGFSDMTHFGRAFKKTYGMLPSEYRRAKSVR